MMKNRINVGDKVTVTFWPYFDNIVGEVEYKPVSPGDSWIILGESGSVHYVQLFASISKYAETTPVDSDDLPF
jgi:hypothetical protein